MKIDPSRVHVWIVALHEPETLREAAEAFLEPKITMAIVLLIRMAQPLYPSLLK